VISQDNLLEISDISKIFSDEYGTKRKVLENITFAIPVSTPKLTSIIAPFRAGKSTILKIIAGIESPTKGEVILKKEKYLRPNGKIVLIPEESASLPWLNVRKNIELVYRLETCRKNNGSYDINDLIALVGLSGYENHYPNNSSFGFRFRINLARALLLNPIVLLLDDCFRKMDAATREEIYNLLEFVSKKVDAHFLFTTTNIIEAIRLSGRILLMSRAPGRIYKEISVTDEHITDYNDSRFNKYRQLIEKAFSEEKQLGSINFSI
jgi:NitT/TauT family transport system ATP-binding protein